MIDVLQARRVIAPYLDPTPLRRYPTLDELISARVYLKHENHQPTGVFGPRGINLVADLATDARAAGVCAASTGNHGQSWARAGRDAVLLPDVGRIGEPASPYYGATNRWRPR